jgi:hypothetical protein
VSPAPSQDRATIGAIDNPARIHSGGYSIMTHRFVTPVVAAFAVLLFGACGSDATAPQSGHASAVVTDDPGGAPAARVVRTSDATPTADRSAMAQTIDGGSAFSGSMTATMQVAISADGQSWVNLGAPVTSSVQLQTAGDSTTLVSQTTVPVGTYAYVRLVLQDGASAQVSGSLAGIAFTNADVSIGGGGQVVIEKHVSPFTISANTNATIVFDVNSEVWVTAESAQSHTATATELEAAATAAVR